MKRMILSKSNPAAAGSRRAKRRREKRVVVAMSGGVDSSAAAVILQKQGYDCIGVSMKLWPKELCGRHKPKSCCSTQDLNDARAVAAKLGIPFYALDLSGEFKKEVIDYFCKEYLAGRTPNPCIICNNKIKFGALIKKAKELDVQFIATGHYAKIGYNKTKKRFVLKKAKDKVKDQTYVLFGLTQDQLRHIIFPIGGYPKSQVRQICKKANLKTAQKPESQDICFVWDNNYAEFLKSEYGIKPVPGQIVTTDGKILGQHPGTIFFTVGQRRGLGLGGKKEPLYVLEIDAKNNRIVVGTKNELNKKVLFADNVNWINGPYAGEVVGAAPCGRPIKVKAKIRYNHPAAGAMVYLEQNNQVKVVFDKPQSAITPGQAVVFYRGEQVLGGGWIK